MRHACKIWSLLLFYWFISITYLSLYFGVDLSPPPYPHTHTLTPFIKHSFITDIPVTMFLISMGTFRNIYNRNKGLSWGRGVCVSTWLKLIKFSPFQARCSLWTDFLMVPSLPSVSRWVLISNTDYSFKLFAQVIFKLQSQICLSSNCLCR